MTDMMKRRACIDFGTTLTVPTSRFQLVVWVCSNLCVTGKRCLGVASIGIVVLFSSMCNAPLSDNTLSSESAKRYLSQIYARGLISTYFDERVWEIASHYTRGTQFAGKVRINEEPAQDALNIYVFHYDEKLPLWLQGTCNVFPGENVILCDHKLLDSIPSEVPLASGDPASTLMYWLIGHEIGHIVLGHDQRGFMSVQQ